MIFQSFDLCLVCRPLRWHNIATDYNGTVHKFHKIQLFMKIYLPSAFILGNVRAKMIVHAIMIDLDQPDYWYPRKLKQCEKNLCTKSMERCSLVISQILAEFRPERATYKLCIVNSIKWIIQICSNFYCWVSKIAFSSPNPHCCLGKLPL